MHIGQTLGQHIISKSEEYHSRVWMKAAGRWEEYLALKSTLVVRSHTLPTHARTSPHANQNYYLLVNTSDPLWYLSR